MAYTLTTIGNLIKYQDGTPHIRYFAPSAIPDLFSIDPNTLIVKSRMANVWGVEIPLAQLTINGSIPGSVAAFDTAVGLLTKVTTTGGGGGGGVQTVNSGTDITVDNTDPANPIINFTGSAGSSLFPVTGTGTATGDVTGDLNTKTLQINRGSDQFLFIDPTVDAENVAFKAKNTTGSVIQAGFGGSTDASSALGQFFAANGSSGKTASITFSATATADLTYTADTHTFTGNVGIGVTPTVLFQVNDGANELIKIDKTQFRATIQGTDGTATGRLAVAGDLGGGTIFFGLSANDGTNLVDLTGDVTTQTITLRAANGAIMPHIVGGGSTPSIVPGAGAGTSPTVSVGSGSTDIAGYLNITTGTLPTGTNATVATITFNTDFLAAPTSIVLTPANALTAALSGLTMVYVDQVSISTTTFVIKSGTTALTAATGYKFFYQIIE